MCSSGVNDAVKRHAVGRDELSVERGQIPRKGATGGTDALTVERILGGGLHPVGRGFRPVVAPARAVRRRLSTRSLSCSREDIVLSQRPERPPSAVTRRNSADRVATSRPPRFARPRGGRFALHVADGGISGSPPSTMDAVRPGRRDTDVRPLRKTNHEFVLVEVNRRFKEARALANRR